MACLCRVGGGNPTPEYWVEKIELRLIKFVKQRVLGSCDSLSRAQTQFWSKNIHVDTFMTDCGRRAGSGDGFLMEIYKTVKNRFSRGFSHDNRGVGAQVER